MFVYIYPFLHDHNYLSEEWAGTQYSENIDIGVLDQLNVYIVRCQVCWSHHRSKDEDERLDVKQGTECSRVQLRLAAAADMRLIEILERSIGSEMAVSMLCNWKEAFGARVVLQLCWTCQNMNRNHSVQYILEGDRISHLCASCNGPCIFSMCNSVYV